MKTMTCKQLGGPCNKEFHAETFDEMVEMSQINIKALDLIPPETLLK